MIEPDLQLVGPAEFARDQALLLLAGDPALTRLGVTFATVVALPGIGGSYTVPARATEDVLALTWSPPRAAGDGTMCQRVCLSVVPSRDGHRRRGAAVLRAAGRALLGAGGSVPGVAAIGVARPHIQRCVGDGVVTTGFDVLSRG